MTEPPIRERKRARNARKADDDPSEQSSKSPKAEQGSSTTIFYVVGAAFVGLVIYLFPEFVKTLLEPWIEFSEPTLPGYNPNLITDFSADVPKRDAIVEAFKHAWLAYERDAMGDDEYHPISQKGTNLTAAGGIGYTVIDSMDTMILMGLTEETARAREWVANNLSFERDANFNTFETTIRVLGGLLSTYHLSKNDNLYLEKALELTNRMMPVFSTKTGLPLSNINLGQKIGVGDADNNNLVSTAEVATLQLEFKYLSSVSDDDTYWKAVERVMQLINSNHPTPRLASIFMNPDNGQFVTSDIRLGSRGDSFYEYLLKQYLQTSRTEDIYRQMYEESMEAIHQHLVKTSMTSHLIYTSELIPERGPDGDMTWRLTPKQDHLVCFLGGSLMLGAVTTGALVDKVSVPPKHDELSPTGRRDWKTGVELIHTCMETHNTATGLAPEIVHFRIPSDKMDMGGIAPNDWYIKGARPGAYPPLDARYILRPETIESLFIAYRLTADKRYRDSGWKIFQAIEKHCRIETGGYASVINVDELPVRHEDKMETFMMSETLKYLFLLFSDASVIPLTDYVFNTEAHPLPVFVPSIRTGFA
ncbi:glycoside hydrolase [Rickenella mellea]|uniref:alpha-1,2-Mannosidase n=1 Tax=Rickenella mellea TaxID=50990 RepID=A0A4Y7PZV1_9AGAM|nr:glycoside hydrolase [Rickenella mellea]